MKLVVRLVSRRVLAAGCLIAAMVPRLGASEHLLFDGFDAGWRGGWREQRLFSKPTVYSVVEDAGRRVLHAVSEAANAGLAREVIVASPTRAQLAWRWKVRRALMQNTAERERRGDDYTARVIVVFENSVLPLRTRAINYIWAAHEPAGAVFASPYSSNVAMVVLRSGNGDAGVWHGEKRDVLEDYRRFFGRAAMNISGIAVLVDTDNTESVAEAWFADLTLDSEPSPKLRE